jgi:hypothetical protein
MVFPVMEKPHYTQCDFATQQFGKFGDCCANPTPNGCNQPAHPLCAYPAMGLQTFPDYPDRIAVYAQLDLDRPIQVYYVWNPDPADPNALPISHVALIVGEYPNDQFEVYDPQLGQGICAFGNIQCAYGHGTLNYTFTFAP